MLDLIRRVFGHADSLLCPRCENPLEGHSDADCARKMSRRWFFGVALGAVAGAVIAPPAVVGVSRSDLYRIPLQLYRGWSYRKYNPDGGDLGISLASTVAAQIEKIRPGLMKIFESSDEVARMIEKCK